MMANKEKGFEASLKELEEIVSKLESDDLPLEEALKLFESGVGLSRVCNEKLAKAQEKVDELLKELKLPGKESK